MPAKKLRTHQSLPRSGPARESLREKGQFWTPEWIAKAMVAYAAGDTRECIFDPAVGEGAFFSAARHLAPGIALHGSDIDRAIAVKTQRQYAGSKVEVRDFVLAPTPTRHSALVANPPYIRHHRLSEQVKFALRKFALDFTGLKIDGRAGYHVFFLLRALERLEQGGRLCFILPADTFEGVFARSLWEWVAKHYRLDALLTFADDATPFPGVDTNAVIIFLRNEPPADTLTWARCIEHDSNDVFTWVESRFTSLTPHLEQHHVPLDRALANGLSRNPMQEAAGIPLSAFASVMRGIATGANEYFTFTSEQIKSHGIPKKFFVRTAVRTKHVSGDVLRSDHLKQLDKDGHPTYLLCLTGEDRELESTELERYLKMGKKQALHDRPLISTRRPWYRMEQRRKPTFLFAYLGRRNSRFILNEAGVRPLTGFLCVYAHSNDQEHIQRLWRALNDARTLANLRMVGKSYGFGAIKVEPRSLERLILPYEVCEELGLAAPAEDQLPLEDAS
jgi:hypothetical protein